MAWDQCGCDMAHKATWQRHADPHERLHGADVARTPGWWLRGMRVLGW